MTIHQLKDHWNVLSLGTEAKRKEHPNYFHLKSLLTLVSAAREELGVAVLGAVAGVYEKMQTFYELAGTFCIHRGDV